MHSRKTIPCVAGEQLTHRLSTPRRPRKALPRRSPRLLPNNEASLSAEIGTPYMPDAKIHGLLRAHFLDGHPLVWSHERRG